MKIKVILRQCLVLPSILLVLQGCGMVGRTVNQAAGLAGQSARLATRTAGVVARSGVQAVSTVASLVPAKLIFSCIPEGTPIDTPRGPIPIESILPGDEVVGFGGRPVRVLQKHGYAEDPAGRRFLRIGFENGASVSLCDRHRIDGIPAEQVRMGDRIHGQTVSEIEVFGGVKRSYDLLTEDEGYRISGLPVNSMIEEMISASRSEPAPARSPDTSRVDQ